MHPAPAPDALCEAPRPGRREQAKANNRAAILAAARQVFAEIGYEAASVRDIIRRTELASGTFYNYFRSKEEIGAALAEDAAERLRPMLRLHGEQASGLESYLDSVVRAYFRFLLEEQGGAAAPIRALDRIPSLRMATPAQRAVFEEVRAALTRKLGDLLSPRADTPYLAAAAIGVARQMGEEMLARPDPDPEEAAAVAVRFMLHGLPGAARG